MGAPSGWYPDPWQLGPARWWDGGAWTAHVGGGPMPPGWYADPWRLSPARWWDGYAWTEQVVPPPVPAAAEPDPTFPFCGGLWGVAGIATSVVLGQVLVAWLVNSVRISAVVGIPIFYAFVYSGIAATCIMVCRRFGTGSLRDDFGWRGRGTDIWRGLLVWLIGIFVAGLVNAFWIHDRAIARADRQLQYTHIGTLAFAEFAFVAIVIAPVLEELAFRGLLLRAFSERTSVYWAVMIQAVLFGAYHFTPGLGRANEPGVAVRAAIGLVLGVAAARWRRLGPGTVAHATFNTVFVIVAIAAR